MDYTSIAFGLVQAAIAIYKAATGPSEEVLKALNSALEAMEKAQTDRQANHKERVEAPWIRSTLPRSSWRP
jgi:hypothetical protein